MSKLIEIVTTASVVSLLVVSSAWAGKEIPTIAGVGIQRDRVVVSTHTKSSIMLPEKDLVPAVFELLPAEGIDPSLFFGVEASGYIRKVSVDGEIAAGQVVITSVSKNGQYAKISDEGLNAQFDASSQTTVVPESMLEVGGSRTALIRALEHLRSTTMASGGKTSSSESHDDSSGGSSSSVGKSAHDFSSKSSKSDAKPKADAKATTPVVDDKSKQAPQVVANSASIKETTDGCSIRVDIEKGIAIQQSKIEFSSSMKISDEAKPYVGVCADSSKTYSLIKNYDTCPDIIDLETHSATPQYTLTYDLDGSIQTVLQCTKDDIPYQIIQDTKSCEPKIDGSSGKTTPQARLIYHNRAGEVIEVRGCADSDGSYSTSRNYDTCPDIIEQELRIAIPQYTLTHTQDGVTKTIGECTKDESSYPIIQDTKSCEPKIDAIAGQAIPQARLIYHNRSGKAIEVRGCADSDNSYALLKEYDTCPDIIDLDKLIAWSQYKKIHVDKGDVKVISQCTKDEEVPYKITEEEKGCKPRIDLPNLLAIPQVKLVYNNRRGETLEARGCEDAKDKKPYDIVKNYHICSDVLDLDAKEAWPSYIAYYIDDKGETQNIGECIRDDVPYKIIEETNRCQPRVDLEKKLAIPQSLLSYKNRDDVVIEARGCAASTIEKPIKLRTDSKSCTFRHDFDAGLSFVRSSYFYKYKGKTYQASECIDTDKTYKHFKV
ncbi:MAG: hypothetical protein LBS66_02215, partial [Rhodospirillaceae bacterium]|nr:hypothetical protein [Rhodospirillaceae bacterium]